MRLRTPKPCTDATLRSRRDPRPRSRRVACAPLALAVFLAAGAFGCSSTRHAAIPHDTQVRPVMARGLVATTPYRLPATPESAWWSTRRDELPYATVPVDPRDDDTIVYYRSQSLSVGPYRGVIDRSYQRVYIRREVDRRSSYQRY
jgi:hypothetical protein